MATVEALATSHDDLLDKAVVVLDPLREPGRARLVRAFSGRVDHEYVQTPTPTRGSTTSRGQADGRTTTCLR